MSIKSRLAPIFVFRTLSLFITLIFGLSMCSISARAAPAAAVPSGGSKPDPVIANSYTPTDGFCATGYVLCGGQCVLQSDMSAACPSGKLTTSWKRAMAVCPAGEFRREDAMRSSLTLSRPCSLFSGQQACPIPGGGPRDTECVDVSNDIESCKWRWADERHGRPN